MDHNPRIAEAIIELQSQDRPKYAETARRYNIDKSTLWRRFKGKTASNHDANSYSRQKLTSAQEEILIGHVNKLTDRELGVNWVSRFRKRHHDRLSSLYLRTIDHQRKAADNSRHFQNFFNLLREKIEKYNISPSNVYNFDEKGFQIGLSRSTKRVVPREALRRGKLVGASQDGNREFITLIAAICADYSYRHRPSFTKGESKDFQDTWLEDFDHSSEVAFFASTENGWSCDALGLHWLQRIFDCHTKQKAGRAYRLLILDGHNSHINLKFIDYADRNRILIAVLPSHSTHRLQPLDVGLFSALSTYYAQGSDQLMSIGWGLIRLTKRNFWPLFRDAWNQAFTAKNIEAGWRATGIHPLDPGKVLSKISHSSDVTPPQTASEERAMKTPGSLRAIRRITRRLRKEGLMDSESQRSPEHQRNWRHNMSSYNTKIEIYRKRSNLHTKGNAERPWAFSIRKKVVASRSFSVQPRWNWRGDADEQRKQAIEDRRLQVAISREEKARESAEKKNSGLQCVRPCESSREAKRAEKREAAAKLKAERSAREAERQAIREVKFEVAATSKPAVRKRGRWKRVCATGIQPRNNSEEERVKIGSEASVARDHRKYGGRFLSLSGLIFALACRSGNLLHDTIDLTSDDSQTERQIAPTMTVPAIKSTNGLRQLVTATNEGNTHRSESAQATRKRSMLQPFDLTVNFYSKQFPSHSDMIQQIIRRAINDETLIDRDWKLLSACLANNPGSISYYPSQAYETTSLLDLFARFPKQGDCITFKYSLIFLFSYESDNNPDDLFEPAHILSAKNEPLVKKESASSKKRKQLPKTKPTPKNTSKKFKVEAIKEEAENKSTIQVASEADFDFSQDFKSDLGSPGQVLEDIKEGETQEDGISNADGTIGSKWLHVVKLM
ncbi:DDE superfamily endonuclease [Hirsutella rhossiliensis]